MILREVQSALIAKKRFICATASFIASERHADEKESIDKRSAGHECYEHSRPANHNQLNTGVAHG